MLTHRLRRWPNIGWTFRFCLVSVRQVALRGVVFHGVDTNRQTGVTGPVFTRTCLGFCSKSNTGHLSKNIVFGSPLSALTSPMFTVIAMSEFFTTGSNSRPKSLHVHNDESSQLSVIKYNLQAESSNNICLIIYIKKRIIMIFAKLLYKFLLEKSTLIICPMGQLFIHIRTLGKEYKYRLDSENVECFVAVQYQIPHAVCVV